MEKCNRVSLRPQIVSAKVYEGMSEEERFQNVTLRPIIKLQHKLIIAIVDKYLSKEKNIYFALSDKYRPGYITDNFWQDFKMRNDLKGLVMGWFTLEEYLIYSKNESEYNKRMMSILKQRVLDSIDELEVHQEAKKHSAERERITRNFNS